MKPSNESLNKENSTITNQNLIKTKTDKGKKTNNIRFIIIGIPVILLLIIGLFVYYYITELNSSEIFVSSFTKINDKMSYIYKPIIETLSKKETFNDKGNIKLTVSSELLKDAPEYQDIVNLINKTTIDYEINKKDDVLTNIKLLVDNRKVFDIDYYQKNKENFIFLTNIYSKFIKINSNDSKEQKEYNNEEITYLISSIEKSVKKSIKDIKVNKGLIFDNATPTLKISFDITEKEIGEMITKTKKYLKEDKKSKEIITSYYKDFFDENESSLPEVETTSDYNNQYHIEITNTIFSNEIKSLTIKSKIKTEEYNEETGDFAEIETTYTFSYKDQGKEIIIESHSDSNDTKLVLTNTNDNDFKATIYEKENNEYEEKGTLSGMKTETGYVYELNNETLQTKFTLINNNNSYNYSLNLNIIPLFTTINIVANGTVSETKDINKDTSNYVLYENLSETDMQNIMSKILTRVQQVLTSNSIQ